MEGIIKGIKYSSDFSLNSYASEIVYVKLYVYSGDTDDEVEALPVQDNIETPPHVI